MIVAIDGPAGAGKSSVAQAVAERLGFQYIDTGAIYRTVAYMAHRGGIDWGAEDALGALASGLEMRFEVRDGVNTVSVERDGAWDEITGPIRTPEMGQGASRVAAHPKVRAALLDLQRRLGQARDSVLEGRDIGTVVFPQADIKLFLTASADARAKRRRDQLVERAADPTTVPSLEEITAEIKERDIRDSTRAVAPLKPADDAVMVDTTGMEFEAVVAHVLAQVNARRPG